MLADRDSKMKHRFQIIVIIIVVFACNIFVLPAGLFAQNKRIPPIKNYFPNEFKAHRQIWAFEQDKRGLMYIANGKGLLIYSGATWQLLMMSNRGHVRSLHINGNDIYIGANNDFGKAVVSASGILEFKSYLDLVEEKDRNFGRVRTTTFYKGYAYYQSYTRVFRVKGNEIKVWRFPNSNCWRLFNVEDRLLALDLERGLLELNAEGEFELIAHGELMKGIKASFFLPFNGNFITMNGNNELAVFVGKSVKPFINDANDLLKGVPIANALLTANNQIVLHTRSPLGIVVIDSNGNVIYHIDEKAGLISSSVLSIYEDRQGSIWVGTQEGISRVDINSALSEYDDRIDLHGTVQSIFVLDSTLYAGTSQGVVVLDAEGNFNFVGDNHSYIWNLIEWNKKLIVCSSAGSFELDGNQAIPIQSDKMASTAITSARDPQGIIIASDVGFMQFRKRKGNWTKIGEYTNITGSVRGIVEWKKGDFWLRTRSNGLFRVKGAYTDKDFNFDSIDVAHYTSAQGVPIGELKCFMLDDQLILRSEEDDKLFSYDEQQDRFVTYTFSLVVPAQGATLLPKKIMEDGSLWLDGYRNNELFFARATKRPDFSYEYEEFPINKKMLEYKDPYVSEVFYAQQKNIWYSGRKGVIKYALDNQTDTKHPFEVLLSKVALRDSIIHNLFWTSRNREFAFASNDIHFTYTVPAYQNAEHINYAYFLEGNDEEWSQWVESNSKEYTNLAEGNYIFKVKALNDYGLESQVTEWSFSINPPWWLTVWAKTLWVILTLGLFLTIYKLRTASLKRQGRALQEKVDEQTSELTVQNEQLTILNKEKDGILGVVAHDLRSPFNRIKGLTQLVELTSELNEEQEEYFEKINSSIGQGHQLINDLLDISNFQNVGSNVQLNVVEIKVHDLLNELYEATHKNAERKQQSLTIDTDSGILLQTDKFLLWRVLENLTSNAIKYSPKGKPITISARHINEGVEFVVKDEGLGFNEEDKKKMFGKFQKLSARPTGKESSTGLGLSIVKMIVERLGGSIEIESELEAGSSFFVTIPNLNNELSK